MKARATASTKKKPASTTSRKTAPKKKTASRAAPPAKSAGKASAPAKKTAETTSKKATKKRAPPPSPPTTKARARQRDEIGLQYPPGVYDILLGATGTTTLARILALQGTLPSATGVQWQAYKEHWFTNAAIASLPAALSSAAAIRVRYTEGLGNLQTVAAQLANPSLYVWQGIYAKEGLSPNDWLAGTPTYGTPRYYFGPTANTKDLMRMVFELSTANLKKLVRITWLNTVNTLVTYFPGASPGTTIQIPAHTWPPTVSPSFHYRAP